MTDGSATASHACGRPAPDAIDGVTLPTPHSDRGTVGCPLASLKGKVERGPHLPSLPARSFRGSVHWAGIVPWPSHLYPSRRPFSRTAPQPPCAALVPSTSPPRLLVRRDWGVLLTQRADVPIPVQNYTCSGPAGTVRDSHLQVLRSRPLWLALTNAASAPHASDAAVCLV
jgi:hypothetical protein